MNVDVNAANPLLSRYSGESPVMQVGLDIVKRGAIVAPLLIGLGWLIWGADGAYSVALGLGLVLVNMWLSAYVIKVTARISFAALAAGAMFGFLIRLGVITAVVIAIRNVSWVDLVALGITIIISHVGLLFWELRFISASLAYPGLKPGAGVAAKAARATKPGSATTENNNKESVSS